MAHRRFELVVSAALAAGAPSLAGAGERAPVDAAGPARIETLRIEPRAPAAATGGAPAAYAGLLSTPRGWAAGGPAAVVLWEEPGRDDLRDVAVAALLDEGAAVLELDAHAARGVSPDSASAPPPPAPAAPLPDLFAALDALRRDARAGAAVVAVGYGAAGGAAALLAAGEDAAAAHGRADGPRFAGLAALGPGRPAFAGGAPPPGAGGWTARAARLCGALAAAAATAAALAEEVADDCAAAFAPPRGPDPAAPSVLAGRGDGR